MVGIEVMALVFIYIYKYRKRIIMSSLITCCYFVSPLSLSLSSPSFLQLLLLLARILWSNLSIFHSLLFSQKKRERESHREEFVEEKRNEIGLNEKKFSSYAYPFLANPYNVFDKSSICELCRFCCCCCCCWYCYCCCAEYIYGDLVGGYDNDIFHSLRSLYFLYFFVFRSRCMAFFNVLVCIDSNSIVSYRIKIYLIIQLKKLLQLKFQFSSESSFSSSSSCIIMCYCCCCSCVM